MTICNEDIKSCEFNNEHNLSDCLYCIGVRNHGLKLLSKEIKLIPIIDYKYKQISLLSLIKKLENINDLKNLTIDGFDIGMAIYSSLVDREKNIYPDVKKDRKIIESLACDSMQVWLTANDILQERRFDKVYIFNGRFATARPWIRACQKSGIPFTCHERSGVHELIFLYDNTFSHDPNWYTYQIELFWEENKSKPSIIAQGKEFFEERPAGKLSGWESFTKKQQKGVLPKSWSNEKQNVVFFSGTETEIMAISELADASLYKNQKSAILDIVSKSCSLNSNLYFYLRIHPNSKSDLQRWWEFPEIAELHNLEVIAPESNICSYSLMSNADKCITYNSTMGIEATYWGKPSMAVAKSFYSGINAVYEPKSAEEACEWVATSQIPKPQINAIKSGAFWKCSGFHLAESEVVDLHTLKFKNKILDPGEDIMGWVWKCKQRIKTKGILLFLRKISDYIIYNIKLRHLEKNAFLNK
jgi:hypothetical protein